MPHTHHPNNTGPVCRFATKRECDQAWRAYLAAKKARDEERAAAALVEKRAAAERAYQTYQDHERQRIAQGRPPC